MEVQEYIKQKFQSFGLSVSKADLLDICLKGNVRVMDEVNSENIDRLTVSIVMLVPSFLLRYSSKSVSENGHSKSLSWDNNGIKTWYSMMCRKYGLKDEMNAEKPRIKFL